MEISGEGQQTYMRRRRSFGRFSFHTLLVGFPIALLVGVLLADIAYLSTTNAMWPEAAYWLLWAGIGTGIVAALAGLYELTSGPMLRTQPEGWLHGGLNGAVLLLSMLNLGLRQQNRSAIAPWALTISALTTALLILACLYGHDLVQRYRATGRRVVEERDDWLG